MLSIQSASKAIQFPKDSQTTREDPRTQTIRKMGAGTKRKSTKTSSSSGKQTQINMTKSVKNKSKAGDESKRNSSSSSSTGAKGSVMSDLMHLVNDGGDESNTVDLDNAEFVSDGENDGEDHDTNGADGTNGTNGAQDDQAKFAKAKEYVENLFPTILKQSVAVTDGSSDGAAHFQHVDALCTSLSLILQSLESVVSDSFGDLTTFDSVVTGKDAAETIGLSSLNGLSTTISNAIQNNDKMYNMFSSRFTELDRIVNTARKSINEQTKKELNEYMLLFKSACESDSADLKTVVEGLQNDKPELFNKLQTLLTPATKKRDGKRKRAESDEIMTISHGKRIRLALNDAQNLLETLNSFEFIKINSKQNLSRLSRILCGFEDVDGTKHDVTDDAKYDLLQKVALTLVFLCFPQESIDPETEPGSTIHKEAVKRINYLLNKTKKVATTKKLGVLLTSLRPALSDMSKIKPDDPDFFIKEFLKKSDVGEVVKIAEATSERFVETADELLNDF